MNRFSKIFFLALGSGFFGVAVSAEDSKPVYRDVTAPIEARVADLIGRMTLDEKIAQLRCQQLSKNAEFVTHQAFSDDGLKEQLGEGIGELGPIHCEITKEVSLRNTIQKYLREQTRLGIPVIFHDEGCHGLMAAGATSFPAPIGLASSWDEDLMQRVFTVVAGEMRARGIQQALTPVVDICRDPRWGRTDETMGEDPFLNGKLGSAIVRGLQGDGTGKIQSGHVMATLKHFTGHGQPEGGINRGPAMVGTREILDAHALPFRMVVAEAGPAAAMPSYNEVDGVPSHANTWLLQDVLRKDFKFDGLIVSDYGGIGLLETVHHVAANPADAALIAFRAGVEMDLVNGEVFTYLKELVTQNKITEAEINEPVKKILRRKFELGLFENPYTDAPAAAAITHLESSRALALEAAQKSIVLLKNKNQILPLAKGKYKTIAVIGPNANDTRLGGYSGAPWQTITILDGLKKKVGGKMRVTYAEGCKLVRNLPDSMHAWQALDEPEFATDADNEPLIAEAVHIAKSADLIVLVLGENEALAREAWGKAHNGDRASLDLFGSQEKLMDALQALGKPVVVYLMNGKPMAIGKVVERADAVVEGWYMGQETGTAAADVLFGDVNPSGKLTISFPRDADHIPAYYDHKPSARIFDFVDDSSKPLFTFGYGLSYTTFDYSEIKLSNATMSREGQLTASVAVKNIGKVAGDEIVQLYIRDDVSSVTRPVKELRGFQRIHLAPGETKTVSLPITAECLKFHDAHMNYVVEPGTFKVWLAPSSEAGLPATFEVTKDSVLSADTRLKL